MQINILKVLGLQNSTDVIHKFNLSDHYIFYQITEMKKCYLESMSNEIRKRKANWIGHILRRNCILNKLSKER